jgi:hypothetical protein
MVKLIASLLAIKEWWLPTIPVPGTSAENRK